MKNFKRMLSAILILTCGFVSFNINANAQNEKNGVRFDRRR